MPDWDVDQIWNVSLYLQKEEKRWLILTEILPLQICLVSYAPMHRKIKLFEYIVLDFIKKKWIIPLRQSRGE